VTQAGSTRAAPMRVAHISAGSKTWHFVRHFLEMCVAMCVGLAVLDTVYVWLAAQVGITNPYLRFPELSAAVLAFNMTAPMVAWMRFRGMAWNLIAEMSWAMIAEAVLIVLVYWLGLLRNEAVGPTSTLWLWQHGLMMPVMLVPMFLRLDHYTGGMHHQVG
jgi:hypothetical protein